MSATDDLFHRRVFLWQVLGFLAGFGAVAVLAVLEPPDAARDTAGDLVMALFGGLVAGVFAKLFAFGILKRENGILIAAAIGIGCGLALIVTVSLWPSPPRGPNMRMLGLEGASATMRLVQNVVFCSLACLMLADLFMIPAWRAAARRPNRRDGDTGLGDEQQ